ncbi:MAG TPA: sensor histidine kinase [Puia sp.]|nr:sensor histidine kinase [Puia sp.]
MIAIFFSFLIRTRENLDEIKAEKLKAEIASLKSQINPHFLFNTLNTIYTLSLKNDPRASEAIVQLSGIMRYAITDANDAMILLQKEIEYITNYVELQKARLGNTANVLFQCEGNANGKRIAPLILITYIENAFKHGANPDMEGCLIKIVLQIKEIGILLQVFNSKAKRVTPADLTAIGMSNTKHRLDHIYPDKYKLEIDEDEKKYLINLSIQLQ